MRTIPWSTFPFESFDEAGRAGVEEGLGYFTWGPGFNFETYFIVFVALAVFIWVLFTLVVTEDRKLKEQQERLQREAFGQTGPGGIGQEG